MGSGAERFLDHGACEPEQNDAVSRAVEEDAADHETNGEKPGKREVEQRRIDEEIVAIGPVIDVQQRLLQVVDERGHPRFVRVPQDQEGACAPLESVPVVSGVPDDGDAADQQDDDGEQKAPPVGLRPNEPLEPQVGYQQRFLGDEQPADEVGHQVNGGRGAGKGEEPVAPGLDCGEQQEYGSRLPKRHGHTVPADTGKDEVPGAHRAEERRDDRHALSEQVAQEEIEDEQGGDAGRRRRKLASQGGTSRRLT